nr:hypothetical protein [Pimelobacter simplex]
MALTSEEIDLLNKLRARVNKQHRNDELLLRYYQGRQRVEQLGMAIPPEMRRFLVITNWCRTVVDTINDRQQVRWLILPGKETADPKLRAIWDANNLSAHVSMFNARPDDLRPRLHERRHQRGRPRPPAGAGGVPAADGGHHRHPQGADRGGGPVLPEGRRPRQPGTGHAVQAERDDPGRARP